jgi:arylsulfate sulfotransferase
MHHTASSIRGRAAAALILILLLACTAALAEGTTAEPLYGTIVSGIEEQDAIDAQLAAEAEHGYTFDNPLCVINPYGTVPLSAVLIFDTAAETAVTLTVKGHSEEDDVTAEFPAATRHILPVIGLYSGEANTVVLTLSDGSASTVTVQTEAIDDETLLKGEVTVPAGEAYDYSELTFVTIGNTQCVTAYDSKGDLRYYASFKARRTTPIRQLANGHYLVCSDNTAEESDANGGFMEVDLCGKIYRLYTLPGGFHHDVTELPNGNFLVATSQDDLAVVMDRVVEIDRETGDIVWDLDLSDILDSADGSSTLYKATDWAHLNAVSYDEATDSVLLSCRAIDAVVSVDKETSAVNWILGNPEGWTNTDSSLFFTPAEGQADFEWNYGQHDATFLDSTHIMMFDNGTNRYKTVTPEAQRNTLSYSRAVVYAIDPETMTISQEWSYGKERGEEWYSSHFCSVEYDAEESAYWICSGTIESETGVYAADTAATDTAAATTAAADTQTAVTLARIDMVRDSDLLYELVLTASGYRATRLNPYAYATMLDLETPGIVYSYTKAE